jgi:hypothetical protein
MEKTTSLKEWTIVKGKIFTPKLNFYGLMLIFFDNQKNSVENLNLVFSIYSETHEIQLTDSWDTFEKTIQDMVFGANFSQAITMTATDKLKADTKTNIFASELKGSINKNNIPSINTLFKHVFIKIINDDTVEIDCAFEEVSNVELQEGRLREDKVAQDSDLADESMSAPVNYKFVNAKLILAPIDGKLITELQPGDTLMLNLIVMSMAENTIIDKLKLRKPDGTAKPVPAKIVKIQPFGKGYQLLLNIIDNYYVKIIEEERILVKTSKVPLTSEKSKQAYPKIQKAGFEKTGFSWITLAVIVILGIAAIYFVFVGG